MQASSEDIQKLTKGYAAYLAEKEKEASSNVEKIHVDEIASKIASFYEKVRNIIDYREEHLLRKNTIGRILRRRIFLKDFDKNFAEPLIKDLIRAGHLPNDSVPAKEIAAVQTIIDNLIFFLEYPHAGQLTKDELAEWLIDMTAVAIEEELFKPYKEKLLADFMFQTLRKNLIVKNADLLESERDIQLFLAVQRTLFKPDAVQLQYRLLKFAYPNWGKFNPAELEAVAPEIPNIKSGLENYLKHKAALHFLRLTSREKLIFLLIGDLVFSGRPLNGDLDQEIEAVYSARYAKEALQLNRLALLSVISFFLSKILVAVAIEIPLDKYLFAHSFSWLNTGLSIAFPPFLMLAIVAFIKMPSKKNLELASQEVKRVLAGEKKEYAVIIPKKTGWFSEILVRLAYLAVFVFTLYFIVKILLWLKFSVASIVIFCLFTSMVIATGVKVYNRARELNLEKEKATILKFLLDLVTIPFMTIGKWVISGLSKLNVLVLIFNLVIELPFQLFVEFIENFRSFLKSKKEEAN
jgi:hypothetical protein